MTEGMVSRMLTVTPEWASECLKKNKSNRPVRESTVLVYARQMMAGQWRLTHQGICFDSSGNLVDGQHRLNAVVRANVAVKMLVSVLDSEQTAASLPLDLGVKRTLSDLLDIPAAEISTVRLISELSVGGRVRPSMEDTRRLCNVIKHIIVQMDKHLMNASAPFRLGVVLAVWVEPERTSEILKQASEFLRCENITNWWPSMEAFMKATKTRPPSYWTSQFSAKKEYLTRWFIALQNPSHRVNRITNDEGQFKAIKRACDEIMAKA